MSDAGLEQFYRVRTRLSNSFVASGRERLENVGLENV